MTLHTYLMSDLQVFSESTVVIDLVIKMFPRRPFITITIKEEEI